MFHSSHEFVVNLVGSHFLGRHLVGHPLFNDGSLGTLLFVTCFVGNTFLGPSTFAANVFLAVPLQLLLESLPFLFSYVSQRIQYLRASAATKRVDYEIWMDHQN